MDAPRRWRIRLAMGSRPIWQPRWPPQWHRRIQALARMYGTEAIERLAKEMRDGDTSAARIAAAKVWLEQGIGKPI